MEGVERSTPEAQGLNRCMSDFASFPLFRNIPLSWDGMLMDALR